MFEAMYQGQGQSKDKKDRVKVIIEDEIRDRMLSARTCTII